MVVKQPLERTHYFCSKITSPTHMQFFHALALSSLWSLMAFDGVCVFYLQFLHKCCQCTCPHNTISGVFVIRSVNTKTIQGIDTLSQQSHHLICEPPWKPIWITFMCLTYQWIMVCALIYSSHILMQEVMSLKTNLFND